MGIKRTWHPLAHLIPLPDEGTGGGDGANGTGGTNDAGNTNDNGTSKTGDGKPAEAKPDGKSDGKGEGKTFTQAEVDDLIAKRVTRATKGLDDLKAKAAEWDKHQSASATDEQKLAAALEQARKDAAAEATVKANARVVAAEVKASAVAAGFHDPADALARLRDQLSGVDVDDDGQVDAKAVEKLVADLAASAPHLVKGRQGPPPPGQGGVGTGSGGTGRTAASSLEDAITKHYA